MRADMPAHILERARQLGAEAPFAGPWTLDELRRRLLLYEDQSITIIYAPVDYVNADARLLLLGITPGLRQAQIAFETSWAMRDEAPREVGREIKRRAAFAGSMRTNLTAMLDDLGVQELLGVVSTAELFSNRAELLHSSSALRYPVFKGDQNYSGYSPVPTRHAALAWMLEHMLALELKAVPDALIVPLGGSVERALDYLTARGLVSAERWLRGFPHPSGANGHRKAQFRKNRERLISDARRWFQTLRSRKPYQGS